MDWMRQNDSLSRIKERCYCKTEKTTRRCRFFSITKCHRIPNKLSFWRFTCDPVILLVSSSNHCSCCIEEPVQTDVPVEHINASEAKGHPAGIRLTCHACNDVMTWAALTARPWPSASCCLWITLVRTRESISVNSHNIRPWVYFEQGALVEEKFSTVNDMIKRWISCLFLTFTYFLNSIIGFISPLWF